MKEQTEAVKKCLFLIELWFRLRSPKQLNSNRIFSPSRKVGTNTIYHGAFRELPASTTCRYLC